MLAFARERVRELRLTGIELLQADALALPLPDGCLDALTSYTLFEHVAEPDAFGRECRRVLRPGGALSVASTGGSFRVENRFPQPPAELAREVARLEAIAGPWREAVERAAGVAGGTPLDELPKVVRGWGLSDFRVDSWSRTVCLDDARLSPDERHDIVRDYCAVPAGLPPAEADLRRALREAGADPPSSAYLTEGERRRLREMYDLRERLALDEADRQGAGPFYVTSVMLAASGIVV
jgi:SAM-dependent methyltransferase